MQRLKLMENSGYIVCKGRLPNSEKIYSLTKKGCSIIDCDYNNIFAKLDKANHYLACADFYYYLNRPSEFYLEQQYTFLHKNTKYTFRPDIITMINDNWVLVEIDLTNKRFREKIEKWELFYKTNEFTKYFKQFPPIVIVSTNIEKIKNIINDTKTIELNYVFKNYYEIL